MHKSRLERMQLSVESFKNRAKNEREQLAQWFENCGEDELNVETIAQIIRKWKPE